MFSRWKVLILRRNHLVEKQIPKEETDCIGCVDSDIDCVAPEAVGDSDQIDEEFRVCVVSESDI